MIDYGYDDDQDSSMDPSENHSIMKNTLQDKKPFDKINVKEET